jgi:hypothetical protein
MNVVDDKETNTWAIEFGGLINAKFVNIDKCETIEEDWQGSISMFQDWLPSPQGQRRW